LKDLNEKVVLAAKDEKILASLIEEYQNFILSTASKVTGKYITKSEDEWSISLSAFSQAVQDYSSDKGNFLSFAGLIIKRRLIDYLRSQAKHRNEAPIDPFIFSSEHNDDEDDSKIKLEVIKNISAFQDDSIKYEIEAISSTFLSYGFSFMDLAECSPKALKTKAACAKAAAYIIKNPIVLEQMRYSKTLPIKVIEKNSRVPRKILERHRKYIIAAVEIIAGHYPYLAEYMQFIREELSK